MNTLIEHVHGSYTYDRRVKTLCKHLAEILPENIRVLDVGCGDGLLAHLIRQERPDISIHGIDVLIRPHTHIPATVFDGQVIPFPDRSFDVVMFNDVLHHTEDPMVLLREAVRVARQAVVLKDHTRNGLLASTTLRFMDWVGNARHGVVLPYNYWSRQRWVDAFNELGLKTGVWRKDLKLYPQPADWVFGRSLHFITRLELKPE